MSHSAPSIAEMIVTGAQPEIPGFLREERTAFVFESPEEGKAAEVTLEVIKKYVNVDAEAVKVDLIKDGEHDVLDISVALPEGQG